MLRRRSHTKARRHEGGRGQRTALRSCILHSDFGISRGRLSRRHGEHGLSEIGYVLTAFWSSAFCVLTSAFPVAQASFFPCEISCGIVRTVPRIPIPN